MQMNSVEHQTIACNALYRLSNCNNTRNPPQNTIKQQTPQKITYTKNNSKLI